MPLFGRDKDEHPSGRDFPQRDLSELSDERLAEGVFQADEGFEDDDDEGGVVFASFGKPSGVPSDVATPQAEGQATGLYGKFHVERVDGADRPGGPKEGARYFVLDYVHDPVARIALRAYVTELRRKGTDPGLAADLNREINATRKL